MKNVLFFLMAFLFECQIVAQEVIIRGSVADAADGSPLIGANVLVKGTSVGTITDVEGKFSLKVPKGTSKLTFSCVGYQEQEVALKANQTMLDVSMREDSELLDEVVVIGYGGAKKSDLTGAVSVLESSDLLDANPLSVSQGLQGKIAGVNVTQTDGAPGAGMNILIRGINSFSTSTEPLYVVDGVPFEGASSLINPSDIETLTVLKDASSTAIYGSRGANGVILITTKQGKRGNDRIEFSANYGFSNVLKRINVLDGPTYIRYRNEAVSNYMYYDNADDELPYPITGPGYYDPAQGYYRPSYEDFENGYLGIGWGIKYLGHQKFINEENINSILEDIDKKIMERDLRRCVDTSLNQGLEGIFHYILFRLYNSKTTTFDLTYLSELFSSANKLKEYCTNSDSLFLINQYIQWFQNRELEYECTILFRKLYTKGHYKYSNINEWELGIANGYAGLGLNIMKI